MDGDLAVALDEREEDVLAAQTGKQIRARDAGVWIGRMELVSNGAGHGWLAWASWNCVAARRAVLVEAQWLTWADLHRHGCTRSPGKTQEGDTACGTAPVPGRQRC